MTSMKRCFSDDETEITVPSSSPHKLPLVFKKRKVEKVDTIPSPLATIDHNSLIPAGAGTGGLSSSFSPHAARSLLEQTNASIDTVKSLLAHFQKKSRKSVHDRQRIFQLEKQLREHLATRARCDLAICPTLYPTASNAIDSTEELPRTIVNSGVLPMIAGGQPNYGDTIDYGSDDGSDIGSQRNRFVPRGPIADPNECVIFAG